MRAGALRQTGRRVVAGLIILGLVGAGPSMSPVGADLGAGLGTVTVAPDVGLVDGDAVAVTIAGGEPDLFVEVLLCAAGEPEPDGCGHRSLGMGFIGADGSASLGGTVRTMIRRYDGSTTDCRTSACEVLLVGYGPASSGDDDAIERVPVAFDPDAPLLDPPTLSVEPSTRLVDGQTVTISGAGFAPEGFSSVQYCEVGTDDCDRVWSASPDVGPDGTFSFSSELYGDLVTWDRYVDCRTGPGCEVRARDFTHGTTVRAPVRFAPAAPRQRYLDPVFGEVEETRDIVYRSTSDVDGETVDLRMDVYRPIGDTVEARPAIVWLFGGWFMFGDKEQLADYARDAARRGFVGVTIDYRIRPGMALSELESAAGDAYDDALAAIEWLKRNAATYGIDPDTIISAGYSAGGVLAWNLAYLPPERGPATSPVAGSVAIAGLPFAGPQPGDPPVIGFHAADDTVVPIGPARNTCAAAAAQGVVCEWVEYATGGHYVVLDEARDIVRNAYDFIARHVLTPRGYMDEPEPEPGPGPRPTVPSPWPMPTFPLMPSLAPPTTATTTLWSPTSTTAPVAPPSTAVPSTAAPVPSTTVPPTSAPTTSAPNGLAVGGEGFGPRPGPAAVPTPQPNRPTTTPQAPAADPVGARPSYTG